jgi:hypothetical protein
MSTVPEQFALLRPRRLLALAYSADEDTLKVAAELAHTSNARLTVLVRAVRPSLFSPLAPGGGHPLREYLEEDARSRTQQILGAMPAEISVTARTQQLSARAVREAVVAEAQDVVLLSGRHRPAGLAPGEVRKLVRMSLGATIVVL